MLLFLKRELTTLYCTSKTENSSETEKIDDVIIGTKTGKILPTDYKIDVGVDISLQAEQKNSFVSLSCLFLLVSGA
jgi:hypothetical protein